MRLRLCSSLINGAVESKANLCTISYRKTNSTDYRLILTGLAGIVVVEIYAAIMQLEFQNTHNNLGKGFAILGIYLFVTIYCETIIYPYNIYLLSRLIYYRWHAE